MLTTLRPVIMNNYSIEFQNMPPSVIPAHHRRWHVLSLILSQETAIERISANLHRQGRFQCGDAGIYPAGMGERIVWHDKVKAIHVHLNPVAIRAAAKTQFGTENVTLPETFQSRDPALSELAHELDRAINLDISLRKRAVEGLMEEVLGHLVRKYGESETSIKSEGISSNKLETVMAYVSKNLSEKISLDEVGQIVGLSKYHFARVFRSMTGLSPHQYILRCRIERAKYLLSCGDSLPSISYSCGFSDQSHFTRTFRQMTGMTPRQFRTKHIAPNPL
ncbi:MAG TPA: AraC family transcriptional regulator [Pyrinomonadaceae bacterium]|nr:AraC family transcriptional regulator [Pyrinomonadaceae bacterium]